jgi:hypothetical protein
MVEADSEQTIRAIANGFGAGARTMPAAVSEFTTQTQLSTISFVERPTDGSHHAWSGATIGREVARGLLGRDLYLRIRRD